MYLSGDRARGIAAAQRAVALAPQVPGYRLVLGKMLEFKERYAEAMAEYEAFLRLAPAHDEAPRVRLALRLLKER
ncbi:hypothetical protein D3C72_2517200 [compost metagenome]